MTAILLLIICMLASSVGAIVGAGGGVIIKPVLEMKEYWEQYRQPRLQS